MKRKFLSTLLVIILLLPTVIEASAILINHKHLVCMEEGIHFHENLPDCHLCLLTKISSEEFLSVDYNSFVIIFLHDKYIIKDTLLKQLEDLTQFKRGPPNILS